MTFLEKVFMVVAIAAFLMITGVAKAEDKSITPQEFVSNVAEVPSKVGNWLSGEVEKTKAYQTKVWSEAKTKWPWTMFKSKNNATQN
jgi:hypothetical protein